MSDNDIIVLVKVDIRREIHLADVPSDASPEDWIRLVNGKIFSFASHNYLQTHYLKGDHYVPKIVVFGQNIQI